MFKFQLISSILVERIESAISHPYGLKSVVLEEFCEAKMKTRRDFCSLLDSIPLQDSGSFPCTWSFAKFGKREFRNLSDYIGKDNLNLKNLDLSKDYFNFRNSKSLYSKPNSSQDNLNYNLMRNSNGKATTVKKTFSRETEVSILINADRNIIWNLLTNADNFPSWNSTVISIDGSIKQGNTIKLKAKIAPNRTFKIRIKEMAPMKRMVWGDAMGNRTFTLDQIDQGVLFRMSEKIGGFMFPLFANKIPSFDDAFEQYAQDLKKEAESNQNK